jgi:hypothetical protein
MIGRDSAKTFVIEDDNQKTRLTQFIQRRDLPFQVEIGPIREQRSLSQNARLWALHQLASAETGYATDELHEIMLAKHFGTKTVEVGGQRLEVPSKRSSTRDKDEFRAFLDYVENFYAAELGIWLGQDEIAQIAKG